MAETERVIVLFLPGKWTGEFAVPDCLRNLSTALPTLDVFFCSVSSAIIVQSCARIDASSIPVQRADAQVMMHHNS